MSDTVRWCFTHGAKQKIVGRCEEQFDEAGYSKIYMQGECDIGDMVPVRAGTELFQRPPQGDCTICGERNLTNNCFESLDGDAWCDKEGRQR